MTSDKDTFVRLIAAHAAAREQIGAGLREAQAETTSINRRWQTLLLARIADLEHVLSQAGLTVPTSEAWEKEFTALCALQEKPHE